MTRPLHTNHPRGGKKCTYQRDDPTPSNRVLSGSCIMEAASSSTSGVGAKTVPVYQGPSVPEKSSPPITNTKQRFFFDSDVLVLKNNLEWVSTCVWGVCVCVCVCECVCACGVWVCDALYHSYQRLIKTLAVLEAQKIQVIKVNSVVYTLFIIIIAYNYTQEYSWYRIAGNFRWC